tara:strand:+ start:287 stop:589 length:303 start_codon:yes stop_codon:yes gene_type:complete
MQRIRVKGRAFGLHGTPATTMGDMLRYDDGKIEAIWDYPRLASLEDLVSHGSYGLRFTAIVQLNGYTPERWRSFGLVTDILGDVGEYSPEGYTVDQWEAR